MDFFQAQDRARRKSSLLVAYFIAAVGIIVAFFYFIAVSAVLHQRSRDLELELETRGPDLSWWQPDVFALVTAGVLVLVGGGSLIKTISLRSGGAPVARSLGGTLIDTATRDPAERRLLNVVEEMAIASGVRVPEVYLLPEDGINAFAAGWSPDDAVVAVTRGALDTLNRDELQGVVAHEFSHILNGDMRLNIRLLGLIFGILVLAIAGRIVLRGLTRVRPSSSSREKSGGGIIVVIGLVGLSLLVVGYIGVFFGRLIQAAVSRQREFLADAAAVQFTRNPPGITGALKKIGALTAGSQVRNAHATETSHLFFASALGSGLFGAFATHPPLAERIRVIDASFDGTFPALATASRAESTPRAAPPAIPRHAPPPLPLAVVLASFGGASAVSADDAHALLASLPPDLREAAHDPARTRALTLALLVDLTDPIAGTHQIAALKNALTSAEFGHLTEAAPALSTLAPEARLALLDLNLPTLRRLPREQLSSLVATLDSLILADNRVTPFEFALRHILLRTHATVTRAPDRANAAPIPGALIEDRAALLAVMARAGHEGESAARTAFRAGAASLGLTLDLSDKNTDTPRSLNQLATALARLERIPAAQRQALLAALATTASADGTIRPDEHALLRAFAAALDCPAPLGSPA